MKFKRESNPPIDVNLTPLIDVVFLLLIFFMVSTSFVKESHLTLKLPSASTAQQTQSDVQGLEVIVDANGSYRIGDKPLGAGSTEMLGSALRNIAEEDFSMPLTITADAGAPYQSIVTLIDVAGREGFFKIQITTQEQSASE